MENKKPIRSYRDLDVYQSSYQAAILVARNILPKLPDHEKFDLRDQLSRSTKAIPRLIAEGFAKKHQKAGFQKYLDDAMAEANESQVGLEQIKDIYQIEVKLCEDLVAKYEIIAKQLFNLAEAWSRFTARRNSPNNQKPTTPPIAMPNNH